MTRESAEEPVWKAYPSQITAINFYAVCVLLIVGLGLASYYASSADMGGVASYLGYGIVVVLLVAVVKYFLVRTQSYELTDQRLIVWTGILTRQSEEMELYRIRDWSVTQPLLMRIFGLGNINVVSHDATAAALTMVGVAKVNKIKDILRERVEAAREKKSVRHLDVE